MTLGQKIKKLRTEKGLTQKDLADDIHVTFQTVSKWENDENEPDVSTIRELAKLFGCTLDYLLSEEEEIKTNIKENNEDEKIEENNTPIEATKTVVIHQKEMHVCERCKKDIPEDDLMMEDICVDSGGRGRAATYRKAFYHKKCFEQVEKERAAALRKQRAIEGSRNKKVIFGWSIAGGVVAIAIALGVLFGAYPDLLLPIYNVLISIGAGCAIFMMLYCILDGSYIGEVFSTVASWTVRWPGLIFSWSIDGFIWAITMKILFAILSVLLAITMLVLAIGLSSALSIVSFPFLLARDIRHGYDDCLF
ncbi:MAG: helix-turn-helix domain-containing protein [Bacilli bacterium]|nr:helix-turn-helix domain-containing protein [Bacilli bacterium]